MKNLNKQTLALKTTVLPEAKINTFSLILALIFGVLAIFIPSFIHEQWITGPIINTLLFLSVVLIDVKYAIIIGLFPSITALSSGLLPIVLAPMVPFIMFSNTILVLIFGCLKDRNYWLGIFIAALLKFSWLLFNSSIVTKLVVKKTLAAKISQMMNWPQFATAIMGGILAWGIIQFISRQDTIVYNRKNCKED